MGHWSDALVRMRACDEAVTWALGVESYEVAWETCSRGDWLLWLAGRLPSVTRQRMVLAACACARLSLPYVRDRETRPLAAIETAEAWVRGEATIAQVRAASASAAAYAYAASAAAAAAAAASAAAYAYAASAYASAAAYAAGDAAAYAAAYAAADIYSARAEMRKRCADAVRAVIARPELAS